MMEQRTCIKEAEFGSLKADVRVLEQAALERDKKIDRVKSKYETMYEMNTSLKMMNLTLDQVSEHNLRQDKLQEKRDLMAERHNKVLKEISANLTNLSDSHKRLNKKVDSLEDRFDESENKSNIDLRDVNKSTTIKWLQNNSVPAGIGATIALVLAQVVKAFL